ncbi:uncharacterized protein N7477_003387 [Penicillium maclennaniae]|uniref:uncharacterized protein n=1 Tax=Penicillium maclennaniae TaxID=1343394 RepID=UPI00254082AA|nr:uncharacterized protein N7477_003387 [Penicillium maclennaniae]KAJ5677754.1 hypothetical protein N7477_003387 [Penicillium maclennaniae]
MSKNPKLAYDAKEPAFLQKLRGHYGNNDGRLERPAMRPRKAKNSDDDDDAPVYVDEESNEVISKEEYQALVGGTDSQTQEGGSKDQSAEGDDKASTLKEPSAKQNNLTEVGGQKKRKQAKVVGQDTIEEEAKPDSEERPKASARKSKKGKKIKLSFDNE